MVGGPHHVSSPCCPSRPCRLCQTASASSCLSPCFCPSSTITTLLGQVYMPPRSATDHTPHSTDGDVEISGNRSARDHSVSVFLTNAPYALARQLREWMSFPRHTKTPATGHSPLYRGVAHVLRVGAEKQMRWSYTGRDIAGMAHLSIRGRLLASRQRPRHTMGDDLSATDLDSAVSQRSRDGRQLPRPQPTFPPWPMTGRLVHPRPESLGKWNPAPNRRFTHASSPGCLCHPSSSGCTDSIRLYSVGSSIVVAFVQTSKYGQMP